MSAKGIVSEGYGDAWLSWSSTSPDGSSRTRAKAGRTTSRPRPASPQAALLGGKKCDDKWSAKLN